MQLYRKTEHYQKDQGAKPLVVGLGNFDGLHKGHQRLLESVIRTAHQKKAQAAVFTFEQHPQQVLHPSTPPKLLTSVEYKLMLLEQMGLDVCFLIPFTREFARLEPEAFVSKILVGQFHAQGVTMGYNAHFGHDRKGDVTMMRSFAQSFGFDFEEMAPVKEGEWTVSSSHIRRLLDEGRLEEAEACLGRSVSLLATVIKGAGRGENLGFPTANLDIEGQMLPATGVYPVFVREVKLGWECSQEGLSEAFSIARMGGWLEGVLNYGFRPTFEGGAKQPVAEVHLLNFEGDLYGAHLEVLFGPQIRPEKTFSSAEALKVQIGKDIREAQRYLNSAQKKPFTKRVS